MTSRIAATVRRALQIRQPAPVEDVHFHLGGNGLPQVCDRDRCESPGLTGDHLGLARP